MIHEPWSDTIKPFIVVAAAFSFELLIIISISCQSDRYAKI